MHISPGQYVNASTFLGGPWVCPTPHNTTAAGQTCDPCGDHLANPYWGEQLSCISGEVVLLGTVLACCQRYSIACAKCGSEGWCFCLG